MHFYKVNYSQQKKNNTRMSFFYLKPVIGNIPVHLLETIVTRRLAYLKVIFNENSHVYNEYVVEGSLYDNVGHFMLCIVAILGENTGFTQFLLKAELELFKRRIYALSTYDLRCLAKKLLRSIRKQDSVPEFIYPLQILCQHLTIKTIAHHMCTSHINECVTHSINLNFKHCLFLIAKRQVELKNGMVSLPCGKWKEYLMHLFLTNLKYRINTTNLDPLKTDPRILELLYKLKNELLPFLTRTSSDILISNKVDTVSKFFPPCMLNLHQNLRKRHRLSHTQRFYYSLFLKDVGMPVEEAIDFWRAEYRQSPSGSHNCCHYWEKDEKKYLYGIRHMYGLEGRRKSYTSVSCQRIQNSDMSCNEGGCPFKSFDNLEKLLLQYNPSCTDTLLSKINELKRKRQYSTACILYLKSFQPNCDNLSYNLTPVKYYNVAMKCNSVEL